MGRIRKFAVEMTRRVNRGESQTGPSPALGTPHQTPVPTSPQRWRRRAAWQRQSPTPLKSGPLTDSCTEPIIVVGLATSEDSRAARPRQRADTVTCIPIRKWLRDLGERVG